MQTRRTFNPKRRIAPRTSDLEALCQELLERVCYTGNPQHKRFPGDYGLLPPTDPRPGKTLCDATERILKGQALALLRSGLEHYMVSVQRYAGFPQNIWTVDEKNNVFEAQLENRATGQYHGYPLPEADDFRKVVEKAWAERSVVQGGSVDRAVAGASHGTSEGTGRCHW